MNEVGKRVLVGTTVIAVFALISAASALVGQSAASDASTIRGGIDPATFDQTQNLTGEELRDALQIPVLVWTFNEDGAIQLTAPEGYRHLEDCGEGIAALRVVLGDGSAFCIPGASSSPGSAFQAASAILRITQNRLPSDTELSILRVENELAFVEPDSAEHDALIAELLELEDSLTPSERATIEEAYGALAVKG